MKQQHHYLGLGAQEHAKISYRHSSVHAGKPDNELEGLMSLITNTIKKVAWVKSTVKFKCKVYGAIVR